MPGISFLSKKKWHPSTLANQKQVFLAEQEAGLRRKADDIAQHEMNAELAAMEEVKESRNFADADPRDSSLKFMYNQPLVYGKAVEQRVMANGDDEMVATFRSKVFGNAISASTQLEIHGDKDVLLEPEKSVGFKRSLNELTKEELEERHPRLKNAPIEGGYSKKVVVHHKPFSDVIRNVRCLRCRQWGHQSGDRECSMRDNNPLDVVRLKREDPLTQINNELLAIKNSKIVLKPSAAALVASPSVLDSLLPEEELIEDEADYLAKLSTREKKHLLRRLEGLESGGGSPSVFSEDSSDLKNKAKRKHKSSGDSKKSKSKKSKKSKNEKKGRYLLDD